MAQCSKRHRPGRHVLTASLTRLIVGATLAIGPVALAVADTLISDRVVVLEADGRTHTVQHTLLSEGPLVTLSLPRSVVPQRVAFGGPERVTFRSAWQANPEQLALWSGSAFARYRHQYGDEVQALPGGGWRLRVSSIPAGLSIEAPDDAGTDGAADVTTDEAAVEAAVEASGDVPRDEPAARTDVASTWVFPSDVDVLDWQADGSSDGEWTFEDNSLGWQQSGSEPVALTITYRTRGVTAPLADSLAPAGTDELIEQEPVELVLVDEGPGDALPDAQPAGDEPGEIARLEEPVQREQTDRPASPDPAVEPAQPEQLAQAEASAPPAPPTEPAPLADPPAPGEDRDGDGVPDASDVCLGPPKAALPPPWGGPTEQELAGLSPLPGCGDELSVVLGGIGFDVGTSRLDASARQALDRVATALGEQPGDAYEIAAHTDNQGLWQNNLALSAQRARAVRQYLLLRGVSAERLSATGHGESRPLVDNDTPQGRRENRRIELGPLPPGAPKDGAGAQ